METRADDLLVRKQSEQPGEPGKWLIADKKHRHSPGLIKACDVFNWGERWLKIRTKEPQRIWSSQRECWVYSKLIPFRPNTIQRILCQYLARCWHHKFPVRIWVPKGRQQGTSTWVQWLLFSLCEMVPGFNAAVVAHTEAGATEIFGKSKTFVKNLGDWPIELESDQGGYMKWVSESALWVGTIKAGDDLGKGPTLDAIHFSECANFADKGIDADGAVASILNAVAEHKGNIIVYESTAKGRDAFYYPGCLAAKDPDSGSLDTLIFLPWFLDEGYSTPWEDHREECLQFGKPDPGEFFQIAPEENLLRNRLSEFVVGKGESLYRYRWDLTDEQLIWRRRKIASKACGAGRMDLWDRYYPTFLEDAFKATTGSFFRDETIVAFQNTAKPPLTRGKMRNNQFFHNSKGPLRIWEPPQDGREYVIGADVGGELKESDYHNAYVVDNASLDVVALLRGQFDYEEFSDQLMMLGLYYNMAKLAVENNHNPAVANRCHKKGYPALYYYYDEGNSGDKGRKVAGFNTNMKTRPEALSILERVCRKGMLDCWDEGFASEMDTFVWHPQAQDRTKGKYKAAFGKYDDRILSMAIAVMISDGKDELLNDKAKDLARQQSPIEIFRLRMERLREAQPDRSFTNLAAGSDPHAS
jgi:hypothetical protein